MKFLPPFAPFTRALVVAVFLLLASFNARALSEGDIMFVAFNADGNDGFAILALVDIPANTTIYFVDNEWNGSPIGSGGAFNDASESELTWNSGTSVISAGTVLTFSETNNTGNTTYGAWEGVPGDMDAVIIGTLTGILQPDWSDEVIYAFEGTNDTTPTIFLSAIANDGFNATNGQLTNTGLTAGTNATAITGDEDIMAYTGSCDGNAATVRSNIATASNWGTDDGGGNQTQDGGIDFPDSVPDCFSALPIELLSFTAHLNGREVELNWSTASEINNDYFTIERSKNAVEWQEVIRVPGAGYSPSILSYNAVDHSPYYFSTYYRLKQTDFDGQFELFPHILVKNSDLPDLSIESTFPNPTAGAVQINYVSNNTKPVELYLYNSNGALVMEKTLKNRPGFNRLTLYTEQMASGIYLLSLENGENRSQHKIIKE